jgi:phosphatidate phosphatase APP1
MSETGPVRSRWIERTRHDLAALSQKAAAAFEDKLHRMHERHAQLPYHIDAYRGMVDGKRHCRLAGRVLGRPQWANAVAEDDWWDNLRNSYRRIDAESMPGVKVDVTFRGVSATATTDAEGYYEAELKLTESRMQDAALWEMAEVRRSEGGPSFLQSVMCVPKTAKFGLISDIDDTIVHSNVSNWRAALGNVLLSNARTRKPLEGVGELYTAFQQGVGGSGPNPVFYVSAGAWNMYSLLVDFMEVNKIPAGPIQLRDIDLDRASLLNHAGPRSKLAKIQDIIDRFPALQWVLVGDSGQIDAELYAQTVLKYPGRVLAVYIRDIDPGADSQRDRFVDTQIQQIASAKVPMLRVGDGKQIAEHARSLGLIAPEKVEDVAKDVAKDKVAPAPEVAAAPPGPHPAG